jgi:methionine-rich copper-binding protein CopC
MRSRLPVAVAVAVATIGLLVPATAARAALLAHAELVSTTPKDGSKVDTATEVTMTFSEDVNQKFLDVRVEGPGGDEASGGPTSKGPTVTQALEEDLPAGTHTVTYRVVSNDGHPVSGSFTFTTTAAPASATPTPTPTPTTASPTTTPTTVSSPAPSPSVTATPTSSEGSPAWLVPTLVGLLLVVLLAGGFLLARPRRTPEDGEDA